MSINRKLMNLGFLTIALTLGASSLLHAETSLPVQPTTKVELVQEVEKVATKCRQLIQTVDGKSCLWKWKWHHGKCLLAPRKCPQLHTAEKKFNQKDYEETVGQMKQYVSDREKELIERVQKGELTKKLVVDTGLDAQALASGCSGNVSSLKGILSHIEQLYKGVFGKVCK